MRFAWLRKRLGGQAPVKQGYLNRLTTIAYNAVWWLPLLLVVTKVVDYRTGFVAFLAVTLFRAAANLYRNNYLTLEQAERFPLRSPSS